MADNPAKAPEKIEKTSPSTLQPWRPFENLRREVDRLFDDFSVTYHNAENGFCVLRARARGHREVVTVVGHAAAKLPFSVHAHMLRHSAGYKLAGDGHDTRSIQDYLGHRDIRHTVKYTELSPKPFRDFWR